MAGPTRSPHPSSPSSVVWERLKDACPRPVRSAWRRLRTGVQAVSHALGLSVFACRVSGLTIRLAVSSDIELARARTYETKEPETLAWLKGHLGRGGVFYDVGANIGQYSLFAALYDPTCTVYAFEPAGHNFVRLCANIALNSVTNIVPCNFPIAAREGFGTLALRNMDAGSSLHQFSTGACGPEGAGVMRQGSLCASLDALVRDHGLPQPTLLKIDVDGIEEEILRGARNVLRSPPLRSVLVELNLRSPGQFDEFVGAFREDGLELAGTSAWTTVEDGITSRNCIFQRP